MSTRTVNKSVISATGSGHWVLVQSNDAYIQLSVYVPTSITIKQIDEGKVIELKVKVKNISEVKGLSVVDLFLRIDVDDIKLNGGNEGLEYVTPKISQFESGPFSNTLDNFGMPNVAQGSETNPQSFYFLIEDSTSLPTDWEEIDDNYFNEIDFRPAYKIDYSSVEYCDVVKVATQKL
ncbi:MAG: hypothetical protein F6J92_28175 [Symploca sp. SIO1A3]|nr:hypothetical protein [Symploca sp. SIO1A3]